jgi:hypothetical protein
MSDDKTPAGNAPPLSPAAREALDYFKMWFGQLPDDAKQVVVRWLLSRVVPTVEQVLILARSLSLEEQDRLVLNFFNLLQPTREEAMQRVFQLLDRMAKRHAQNDLIPQFEKDQLEAKKARDRKEDPLVSEAVRAAVNLRSTTNLSWTQVANRLHRDRPELFQDLAPWPLTTAEYQRLGKRLKAGSIRRQKKEKEGGTD